MGNNKRGPKWNYSFFGGFYRQQQSRTKNETILLWATTNEEQNETILFLEVSIGNNNPGPKMKLFFCGQQQTRSKMKLFFFWRFLYATTKPEPKMKLFFCGQQQTRSKMKLFFFWRFLYATTKPEPKMKLFFCGQQQTRTKMKLFFFGGFYRQHQTRTKNETIASIQLSCNQTWNNLYACIVPNDLVYFLWILTISLICLLKRVRASWRPVLGGSLPPKIGYSPPPQKKI